jgi:hypothetical protein
MNFEDAIKAHAAWKMKLQNYISAGDKSLKPGEVKADNRCELGKWIHGEGIRLAGVPEYATLKAEHARFHVAAGEIVEKANAGQSVSAEMVLGGKSAFATASTAVVTAIMAMRGKIK